MELLMYIIGAVVFLAGAALIILYSIKSYRIQRNSNDAKIRSIRVYLQKNSSNYGVSNHGTSMDSVKEIQSISPEKMGV